MAKKPIMVVVSLLGGTTYPGQVRIRPGINKLDSKLIETVKKANKCDGIKIVTEAEAETLLAEKRSKVEKSKVESPTDGQPEPKTDSPPEKGSESPNSEPGSDGS